MKHATKQYSPDTKPTNYTELDDLIKADEVWHVHKQRNLRWLENTAYSTVGFILAMLFTTSWIAGGAGIALLVVMYLLDRRWNHQLDQHLVDCPDNDDVYWALVDEVDEQVHGKEPEPVLEAWDDGPWPFDPDDRDDYGDRALDQSI